MAKNKGKNKQSIKNQNIGRPQPKTTMADVAPKIDAFKSEVEASGIEEVPAADLSTEETRKVLDASLPEDLRLYLSYLEQLNRTINGRKKSLDQREADIEEREEKQKADIEKRNQAIVEEDKKRKEEKDKFDERVKSVNEKEKEVLERELQLDNGEYTGTIRSLLDQFTASEKEITEGTRALLSDITSKHNEILSKEAELSDKMAEAEEAKRQYERKQKRLDIDMERKVKEKETEIREEFEDRLNDVTFKAESLSHKNSRLQNKVVELEGLRNSLIAAFGEIAPEAIVSQLERLKSERDSLVERLSERPTVEEIDTKKRQIEELEKGYRDLKSQLDENETLRLKTILSQSDSYVVEINGYKQREESAKHREDSLKRTISELQETIDQLKGEREKDEEAFGFARKYDAALELKEVTKLGIPAGFDLNKMVKYLQGKMASIEGNPLYYDLVTIRLFLAGLNMSNISILEGISGTGKTSLPREFAKFLTSGSNQYRGNGQDKTPNAPYRICAIQSGWRDNMDLMGYYNYFEHKYHETEFFRALYLANLPKYQDTIFFIILDEMNLSRPEHYFADFLSLLEQDEEQRFIEINGPAEVLPKEAEGGKLRVPKNVRFIGTANQDETTLSFAPKTYDRSNLLVMPKNIKPVTATESNDYFITYSWLARQFNDANTRHNKYYLTFKEFYESKTIKDLLSAKNIGIGNRFDKQARLFITTFVESGEKGSIAESESLAIAADHLISSRLLRSLGNNYELTKSELQEFREKFNKEFKSKFGFSCDLSDKMLEEFIQKKSN